MWEVILPSLSKQWFRTEPSVYCQDSRMTSHLGFLNSPISHNLFSHPHTPLIWVSTAQTGVTHLPQRVPGPPDLGVKEREIERDPDRPKSASFN